MTARAARRSPATSSGESTYMLFTDLFLCLLIVFVMLFNPNAPSLAEADVQEAGDRTDRDETPYYLYLATDGMLYEDSAYLHPVPDDRIGERVSTSGGSVALVAQESVGWQDYVAMLERIRRDHEGVRVRAVMSHTF